MNALANDINRLSSNIKDCLNVNSENTSQNTTQYSILNLQRRLGKFSPVNKTIEEALNTLDAEYIGPLLRLIKPTASFEPIPASLLMGYEKVLSPQINKIFDGYKGSHVVQKVDSGLDENVRIDYHPYLPVMSTYPQLDEKAAKMVDRINDLPSELRISHEQEFNPPVSNYQEKLQYINYHPYESFIRDLNCDKLFNAKTGPYAHLSKSFVNFLRTDHSLDSPETYTYVSDENAFRSFLDELESSVKEYSIFFVDTEASENSYRGETPLIQICLSTGKNFVIKTRAAEIVGLLYLLRPFFADPRIVKVFHDARSDIKWLQRDFRIFCVNVLDTSYLYMLLSKTDKRVGFKHLVEEYCSKVIDKDPQLSNFSLRALTEKQLDYAAADTHYLFKVFHAMFKKFYSSADENKSIEKTEELLHRIISESMDKSTIDCLQLYVEPTVYTLTAYEQELIKELEENAPKFKQLIYLRNKIARQNRVNPYKLFSSKEICELSKMKINSAAQFDKVIKTRFKSTISWSVVMIPKIIEQAEAFLFIFRGEQVNDSKIVASLPTLAPKRKLSEPKWAVKFADQPITIPKGNVFPKRFPVKQKPIPEPVKKVVKNEKTVAAPKKPELEQTSIKKSDLKKKVPKPASYQEFNFKK